MLQNEKLLHAFKVIVEELKKELNEKEINSIELIINKDEHQSSSKNAEVLGVEESVAFLNGTCRWDPVRRRVVCKP